MLKIKYFADRDIFSAGRVAEDDLNRVTAATGGTMQTSVNNVIEEVLGTCEVLGSWDFAKALEVIPRQLCDNARFDATDVLNKLRQKHALPSGEGALYGVDINTGGICDSFANFVWEQAIVKPKQHGERANKDQ